MGSLERRRSPRDKYEIKDGQLFYKGRRLPLPQAAIRAALLDRLERGLWVPDYPSSAPVRLGDDIAGDILQRSGKPR